VPLLRGRGSPPTDPVTAFWIWWRDEGAQRLAAAIAAGGVYGELPARVSALVDAIDPGLQWELGRGHSAEHSLCVTASGDAALRPLAERWRRAGPEPDTTWEFFAARPADPPALTNTLEFGSWTIALAQTRVGLVVDDTRLSVDVACFHPAFAIMPTDARDQVTYLILDWLLGEDDVERWVGHVEHVTADPTGSLPADALAETVNGLSARHTEPSWALLQGTTSNGHRLLVSARRPLRWIDYPLHDQHVTFTLPYANKRDDLLPQPDALEDLRTSEDQISALLGPAVEFVAHETAEGARVLHFYADSASPEPARRARLWADDHKSTRLEITHDPGWSAVRRYR